MGVDVFLAATRDGIARASGERGWAVENVLPDTRVHCFAVDPLEPGVVVRSTDGGETWSAHRRGALRDCHDLRFHATDGRWVYEGGHGGGAVSQDAGETWSSPREGLDHSYGWADAADPARPEVWYVAVAPGPGKAHGPGPAEAFIFRKIGEAPWAKLRGGLPQPLDSMPYTLATLRSAPGCLVAGLANGEVWETGDLGESWTQLPIRLPPNDVILVLREAATQDAGGSRGERAD